MKNILLTGVSKGLGLEIARVLLLEGYRVFGVSRSKTGEIASLQKEFPAFEHITFDLSNTEGIKLEMLGKKLLFETPIHAFINNAALAYDDIITNMNYSRLNEMYQVNVFSPMMISKFMIRNMLLNNIKGVILHVSSISVHTGYKGLSMYASTKGALEAFSKNTAREWGSKGIRSVVVVPGFMETNMSSSLSGDQKDKIAHRTSLGELTNIESVASTIAFLISEKASSITGENIHIDAGTI
jgi:3-oxoacyl-[acyl-carrier protein] reductase